ncbi:MAG: GNAT family N-acetyltransferase [Bacteroidota bacterium]
MSFLPDLHRMLHIRTVQFDEIKELVDLSDQVPELHAPYRASEYERRLTGVPHLMLLAEVNGAAAGFKVGYEREGFWYSWMGGVHPDYRRRGIARQLANVQDAWAQREGYPHVTFKTLNRHRNMLRFALERGFNIIRVEERETVAEYRIWLRKSL